MATYLHHIIYGDWDRDFVIKIGTRTETQIQYLRDSGPGLEQISGTGTGFQIRKTKEIRDSVPGTENFPGLISYPTNKIPNSGDENPEVSKNPESRGVKFGI